MLPALLAAGLTEQQEANSEPSGTQGHKCELSEDIVATVVTQERF